MVTLLRKWLLRAAYWACYPLPVRSKVVLASNQGSSLRGNLKFVHAELVRRGLGDAVVCHLHRPGRGVVGKLGTLWSAIVAEYHLATAAVFVVDDYYFPIYVIRPKPGTAIVQAWHACGPFKKIGYSVLDKSFGASESLVRSVRIHSNYTHCLAASTHAIPYYSEAFGQPAEKFAVLGFPRTDVFADAEGVARIAEQTRTSLGVPPEKHVVLYAPTFRGDSRYEARYDHGLDLAVMREALGTGWVVVVRLHPFVASTFEVPAGLDDFVIDASAYDDFNELLIAADALVTDYSSAIFEYSLLDRPMVFFAPDLESYEGERGFYFDYESGVPGPVFTTSDDVAAYLAGHDHSLDRVRAFRGRWMQVADGRSSERFVSELVAPYLSQR